MSELKQLVKLASAICDSPAKNVNQINQLIPGLLNLIEQETLDLASKEKILDVAILLIESFGKANILTSNDYALILRRDNTSQNQVALFLVQRLTVLLDTLCTNP